EQRIHRACILCNCWHAAVARAGHGVGDDRRAGEPITGGEYCRPRRSIRRRDVDARNGPGGWPGRGVNYGRRGVGGTPAPQAAADGLGNVSWAMSFPLSVATETNRISVLPTGCPSSFESTRQFFVAEFASIPPRLSRNSGEFRYENW